ncbi:hypothetical protein GUITHDRAFT_117939 [Guillardia theta CCMP2712]|uniref:Armadillo repeat-containing domain-containing protein n=1 Tax=Guillardia theta (strain CCMP2712) TaxID=905079 RepID=L1II58_GUITC|nr:hypothetical protein GUITHDRAFT_117939 [Guillardia theta CCMP2712]EKX35906.1 hypothetical protein GUITHDRAFT_117939 [Guillardia theta CCMP2712]|eukprot:XP_005822886.1 hypothetical protein GUITHDRAFT_117939 [Guillardia theta CCMP2712]
MRVHPASQAVQQQACRALQSLAVNDDNEVKIAGLGGIEAVLAAMQTCSSSHPVQEQACGAVRSLACNADNTSMPNLALNADNSVKIVRLGGIEAVLAAIEADRSSEDLQHQAIWFQASGSNAIRKSLRTIHRHVRTFLSDAMGRFKKNDFI